MTRDQYAAFALIGLMSEKVPEGGTSLVVYLTRSLNPSTLQQRFAQASYILADAMVAEANKKQLM